ncbi:MAG: PHB depolymerase family esterase [Bryobacteraceae bacterium]|nr:PHB depolymerase family esterase [Bryobacteraceae bacterium]
MPTRRIVMCALLAGWCSRAESSSRLRARPGKAGSAEGGFPSGASPLDLRAERDSLLYVPAAAGGSSKAVPLVVYLHGATGNAQQGIRRFSALADEFGFLLLSPASEDGTWDAIRSGYGGDVRFLDQALTKVFARHRVDSKSIAVCGFSDGASYALGLGLSNGDLFRHVMAFSPGFIPAGVERTGMPGIFISHGTKDQILDIDRCSRRLVPQLKRAGYRVRFEEFDGPHTLPPDIAHAGMEWALSKSG